MRLSGVRPDGVRWLALNFPLRPDFLAEIVVPFDLTPREAERLAAFIKALPMPEGEPSTGDE